MPLHRPLFLLPPESAHTVAMLALETVATRPRLCALGRARLAWTNAALETTAFGLRFPNPVGVAAGFDKDGRTVAALESIGFGFVEVGTVTPLPQPGNDGPRVARLADERALVNRLGFPSHGARAVAARLGAARVRDRMPKGPLGINIGPNRSTPPERLPADYLEALGTLYAAGDYFVVNISSPNTPGLRELHRVDLLDDLLAAVSGEIARLAAGESAQPKPLLVKVSPDEPAERLDDIAELVVRRGAAGVVVANTSVASPLVERAGLGGGGLSGAPVRALTTALVREFYLRLRGRAEIIGVGGVFTADDAYEKIRAGASLVQVYTGFIYEGLTLPGRLCRGLAALLARDGFSGVAEAIGADT
jgi:dihydroorotate dehydrogenase